MRGRLHDRARDLVGILRLEDPGPDEIALRAELHRQRGIRGRRDTPGAEQHDWQLLLLGDILHELERHAVLVSLRPQCMRVELAKLADRGRYRTQMRHGLGDIARRKGPLERVWGDEDGARDRGHRRQYRAAVLAVAAP